MVDGSIRLEQMGKGMRIRRLHARSTRVPEPTAAPPLSWSYMQKARYMYRTRRPGPLAHAASKLGEVGPRYEIVQHELVFFACL